jgi:hypothetical protein
MEIVDVTFDSCCNPLIREPSDKHSGLWTDGEWSVQAVGLPRIFKNRVGIGVKRPKVASNLSAGGLLCPLVGCSNGQKLNVQ